MREVPYSIPNYFALKVIDKDEIKSQGVKSKHTGQDHDYYNFIVTSVSVTDDETDPQCQLTSVKDKTIVLEKHNLSGSGLVSLAQDKFIVCDLIIQRFTVIARVDNPDGLLMRDIFKVPCFSGQEFVIFLDRSKGFFLVNLVTGKR